MKLRLIVWLMSLTIGYLYTMGICVPDPCDACNSEQHCVNNQCEPGAGPNSPPVQISPKPSFIKENSVSPPVSTPESTPASTPKKKLMLTNESTQVSKPKKIPTLPPATQVNPIKNLISEKDWETLFPNRWFKASNWKNEYNPSAFWYYPSMAVDYYSYNTFITAVQRLAEAGHAEFANVPGTTDEDKKREICAFLGNAAHETGRGSDGLYYREELTYERTPGGNPGQYRSVGSRSTYRMSDKPVMFRQGTKSVGKVRFTSVSYHGRGPLQLSWGYNYGDYSKAVFGDPQLLLDNPDRILDEAELGFGAALWFWMTQPDYRMSHNCHRVIYKKTCTLSSWGFGPTIMAINGGIEANAQENSSSPAGQKVTRRISNYRRCAKYFGIPIGINGEQLDTLGLSN